MKTRIATMEPEEEPNKDAEGGKPPAKKRASGKGGRPKGSVALTPEIANMIITYIRAGAFDHVAAEAAGVSARVLRDWLARGENRHPSRTSTPVLRDFAKAIRKARAEARAAAEIRVYQEQPRYWLTHAARTKQEREGWTEHRKGAEQTASQDMPAASAEELQTELEDLLWAMGPSVPMPPCSHPRCRCDWHDAEKVKAYRGRHEDS